MSDLAPIEEGGRIVVILPVSLWFQFAVGGKPAAAAETPRR